MTEYDQIKMLYIVISKSELEPWNIFDLILLLNHYYYYYWVLSVVLNLDSQQFGKNHFSFQRKFYSTFFYNLIIIFKTLLKIFLFFKKFSKSSSIYFFSAT